LLWINETWGSVNPFGIANSVRSTISSSRERISARTLLWRCALGHSSDGCSVPTRTTAELDVLDSREAGGVFLRGGGVRMLAYTGAVTTSIAAMPFVTRHLRRRTSATTSR